VVGRVKGGCHHLDYWNEYKGETNSVI
jgi:hypothetical protein